ncbi:MAG: tetratricopeptide repeat protein [Acidobacteria bacterium]|nr:tetratricopeptide repeat protein [Acidobacteriota bacterium]
MESHGNYNEALAAFDAALQTNPEFEDALFNRGQALNHLDRYQEALDSLDHALRLNPEDIEVLVEKAYALEKLSTTSRGFSCYKKRTEALAKGCESSRRQEAADFPRVVSTGYRMPSPSGNAAPVHCRRRKPECVEYIHAGILCRPSLALPGESLGKCREDICEPEGHFKLALRWCEGVDDRKAGNPFRREAPLQG